MSVVVAWLNTRLIITRFRQGILKPEVLLYVDLLFDWFGISCMITDNFCFYFKKRLIQTNKTGGQQYNDTSPFSIPWGSIIVPKTSCLTGLQ